MNGIVILLLLVLGLFSLSLLFDNLFYEDKSQKNH
jgi:hypothetical protein